MDPLTIATLIADLLLALPAPARAPDPPPPQVEMRGYQQIKAEIDQALAEKEACAMLVVPGMKGPDMRRLCGDPDRWTYHAWYYGRVLVRVEHGYAPNAPAVVTAMPVKN